MPREIVGRAGAIDVERIGSPQWHREMNNLFASLRADLNRLGQRIVVGKEATVPVAGSPIGDVLGGQAKKERLGRERSCQQVRQVANGTRGEGTIATGVGDVRVGRRRIEARMVVLASANRLGKEVEDVEDHPLGAILPVLFDVLPLHDWEGLQDVLYILSSEAIEVEECGVEFGPKK